MDNSTIEEKLWQDYLSWDEETQIAFRENALPDLGRWVRNRFRMWENASWEPDIRGGVDYSPNHPDNRSAVIIASVRERACYIND